MAASQISQWPDPAAFIHRIIIMCAGKAERMNGVVKQLLPIGGMPLIERTVGQCRAEGFGPDSITVVHVDPELQVQGAACLRLQDHPPTLMQSMIGTLGLVGTKRTTYLLGDVVWTNTALAKVLRCRAPLDFFGRPGANELTGCRWGELFAMSAAAPYGRLERFMRSTKGRGKMWDLLARSQQDPLSYFVDVEDPLVDDIDTPQEAECMNVLHSA